MPTYQYACTECGHRFEAVQSFTDDTLTDCPQCTGRLRKVFNSVGVVFKGSGFYRNDSRESPKGDDKKPDKKSEDKPGEKKPEKDAKPKSDATKSPSTPSNSKSSPAGAGSGGGSSTRGSAA
ncbi:MAG: FmdB family zinc ribbon protein [Actinomycetes bacterium]